MKGDTSSFSMSGHVPYIYRPIVTRVALAASVSQIQKDLPRMCFKLVSEYIYIAPMASVKKRHALTKFGFRAIL